MVATGTFHLGFHDFYEQMFRFKRVALKRSGSSHFISLPFSIKDTTNKRDPNQISRQAFSVLSSKKKRSR